MHPVSFATSIVASVMFGGYIKPLASLKWAVMSACVFDSCDDLQS